MKRVVMVTDLLWLLHSPAPRQQTQIPPPRICARGTEPIPLEQFEGDELDDLLERLKRSS